MLRPYVRVALPPGTILILIPDKKIDTTLDRSLQLGRRRTVDRLDPGRVESRRLDLLIHRRRVVFRVLTEDRNESEEQNANDDRK